MDHAQTNMTRTVHQMDEPMGTFACLGLHDVKVVIP